MSVKQNNLKSWFKSGSPWIWMNAGAVSIAIVMVIGLLAVIAVRGLAHFWPADIDEGNYLVPGQTATVMAGEVVQKEEIPRARLASAGLPVNVDGGEFMTRELLKVGNRDFYGADFSWVVGEWLTDLRKPKDMTAFERREWGNFYGYVVNVKEEGRLIAEGEAAWPELQKRLQRVDELHSEISRIEKRDIGRINAGLERVRLQTRRLELDGKLTDAAQADLAAERARWDAEYKVLEQELNARYEQFNRDRKSVV